MNKLIYKILIPCLLLLVSACNQQEKVNPPFLYVIFTDSTYPDSELIALDKNGLITERKQIERKNNCLAKAEVGYNQAFCNSPTPWRTSSQVKLLKPSFTIGLSGLFFTKKSEVG